MSGRRFLIPVAYGSILSGFAVSLALSRSGQSTTFEHAIMSDLLSPEDNPRGYIFAVAGTAIGAILLLPLTMGFRAEKVRRPGSWLLVGAWLYRLGLLLSVITAFTTPFQASYLPSHVFLAFMAFMALAAGLAVILLSVACFTCRSRATTLVLGSLHGAAFLFLATIFWIPDFFDGRRWFLGLCEWSLAVLIAIGTMVAVRTGGAEPDKAHQPPTSTSTLTLR